MEVNMIENVVVEPMTEEFIVWRCLHGGPLSCKTIDLWSECMLTLHNHPCLVCTSQEGIIALPVMRHRLLINFTAESENVSRDDIIEQLLQELPKSV